MSGRALSFVRTAVLSGEGHADEKELEHVEVSHAANADAGGKASAIERDLRILNERAAGGGPTSLFDQLKDNKERQDEEWRAMHGGDGPTTLREEDVEFLNAQQQLEADREADLKREEEAQLAAFTAAKESLQKTSNASPTTADSAQKELSGTKNSEMIGLFSTEKITFPQSNESNVAVVARRKGGAGKRKPNAGETSFAPAAKVAPKRTKTSSSEKVENGSESDSSEDSSECGFPSLVPY